jgi:O-antigen ligase
MTLAARANGQVQSRLRDLADGLATAVVISLPWSTSATAILVSAWLVAFVPTLQRDDLGGVMRHPAAYLPVMLFGLIAIGTLWADDVAWAERTRGLSGYVKLLILPLLFVQFRRSAHAHWVLHGFLASCAVLLIVSTASFLWPESRLWSWAKAPGIPVKDYLIQAALFVVSAFVLLDLAQRAWRARRSLYATAYAAGAVAFITNIAFVAASRTALLSVPVLLILLALRQFRWKGLLTVMLGTAIFTGAMWTSSDYLRGRIGNLASEIERYHADGSRSSAGERLEFWKKSVGFITEAPVFGHGTGATRVLFARAASGEGVSALVSTNPHNQFLAVAVQVGLAGGVLLMAMWIVHAALFWQAGLAAWIGLLIVAQNIFGSLFNSHLSDFGQGWLYVFGVGVAGGVILAERENEQYRERPAVRAP